MHPGPLRPAARLADYSGCGETVFAEGRVCTARYSCQRAPPESAAWHGLL